MTSLHRWAKWAALQTNDPVAAARVSKFLKDAKSVNDTAAIAEFTAALDRVQEPQLEAPHARWIRDVFNELSRTRQLYVTDSTIQLAGIVPSEVIAWSQLTGIQLEPWEFNLVQQIDSIYTYEVNTTKR